MKNDAIRFFLCTALAIILSLNASAQTEPGQIKAARVEGEVMKLVKDSPAVAIKNGDVLVETDVVTTGKNSSVVLVFMNGSSVKLGAESRLAIDEFKMDPLADDIKMSDLKAEPTVSKTALNLSYGEMVGDVKKLNKSSSYSIKTPVGAAGIRGTIFRIVFRPDPSGKAFFTVSTAEGRVVMEGITAQEIPIVEGKEVVVTIDIPTTPTAPGETPPPPVAPVIETHDIPAATKAIIAAASVAISETVKDTVFTQDTKAAEDKAAADKAAADKAAADKAAADKAAADKAAAETPKAETPTPPTLPQPAPIPLTPGAGG